MPERMIDKERRTEAEPLANYRDCEKRDAPVLLTFVTLMGR